MRRILLGLVLLAALATPSLTAATDGYSNVPYFLTWGTGNRGTFVVGLPWKFPVPAAFEVGWKSDHPVSFLWGKDIDSDELRLGLGVGRLSKGRLNVVPMIGRYFWWKAPPRDFQEGGSTYLGAHADYRRVAAGLAVTTTGKIFASIGVKIR